MASGPFTLAQLARAVGMSIEDVQLYWDCGLLQSPRRRVGRSGDAAYHDEHLKRLLFIQRALAYGFSLEAIARLLAIYGMVTCNDVHRIATDQLEELRRVRGQNNATVVALEELVSGCCRNGGRTDCTIIATLENGKHAPLAPG